MRGAGCCRCRARQSRWRAAEGHRAVSQRPCSRFRDAIRTLAGTRLAGRAPGGSKVRCDAHRVREVRGLGRRFPPRRHQKAGRNWPNDLKEPDADRLRGRDGFKKLLAELETRNKAEAATKEAESK